jgi:quercetin dioxygenase-like cupin family protein
MIKPPLSPENASTQSDNASAASSGVRWVRGASRPTVVRAEPMPTLQRLVDRDAGSNEVTILVNELSEGQRVAEHVHDVEEVLIVTSGQCSVQVGDETRIVGTGDAVIVRPNTPHGFRHVGTTSATTIIAVLASPDIQINASS